MTSEAASFQELLNRALEKFCVLAGSVPGGDSATWERDCHESLKVFSQVWKFQQEHRPALVQAGLTRTDIGEIASKIGQLYYNLYLRTSGPSWLLESYTFYEAIHTRGYFATDSASVSVKQLKFYARFLLVCLLLNKKEDAWNLVQEFQALVSSFAMKFSPHEAQEWQAVVHSVTSFLNADVAMPVPRSPGTCIAYRPNLRCCSSGPEAGLMPHVRRLKEVVFANYQHRQVKIAELPIDTFRMMLAMEWHDVRLETAGMDAAEAGHTSSPQHQSEGAAPGLLPVSEDKASEVALTDTGSAAGNCMVPVSGPSGTAGSPASSTFESPHKRLLYRTSAPVLLSYLASSVLGLGPEDLLLLHLVGHGQWGLDPSLKAHGHATPPSKQQRETEPTCDGAWASDDAELQHRLAAVRLGRELDRGEPGSGVSVMTSSLLPEQMEGVPMQPAEASAQLVPLGVLLSPRGSGQGGSAESKASAAAQIVITPSDILPFTRRQLLLVVDSDASQAFEGLGSCAGCAAPLCLLSPPERPSALLSYTGTGAFFTMALTCPVMAFCLLFGEMDPSAQQLTKLEDALDEAFMKLGRTLLGALTPAASSGGPAEPATVPAGNPWAVAVPDVLLRRLILRFIMIRAALFMHVATRDRPECQASCSPALPEAVDPASEICQSAILTVAAVFQKENMFRRPLS